MSKGYWDAAREEAGKEYGKKYAERYERREKLKATAGWVAVAAVALFLAAKTWGVEVWEATRTYLMYGAGALLMFVALGFAVYAYVRFRRTRRNERTYVEW